MHGIVGAIVKYLMSNEYGPADRLVETLVLLLIFYEVAAGIKRHREETKRKKLIENKRKGIYEFAKRGEGLQISMPLGAAEVVKEDRKNWINEVDAWTTETETFLGKLSSRASWRFMQADNPDPKDVMVRLPTGASYCVYDYPDLICYRVLVMRLGNLHRIIENVEAYL